jgi:hypothetical protein
MHALHASVAISFNTARTSSNPHQTPYLWSYAFPTPLTAGSPSSCTPLPLAHNRSCKHCVPVLYYPAHCELHYHIRSFMPSHLTFCSGPCSKYTYAEDKGYSESAEYCGVCGVEYARRYKRGRRILDVRRPGEKQGRLNKWYNRGE